MNYKIVGIGEVLWDMLPSGKQLGGAPTNFAYMISLLGNKGIIASRVGTDKLGQETLATIASLGVSMEFVQDDPIHATGTAVVDVDAQGQPKFTVTPNVAWDFLEWTPAWSRLAPLVDAVCFGSLGQRNLTSRETIRKFLGATPDYAIRIFDVNLRQDFYSTELLQESFQVAELAKLNHEELPTVTQLLGFPFLNEEQAARQLLEAYKLRLVCVTRGGNGSLLI
ncbi:MAG TPA: PfkB family carbohydrate kinase, partial [Terriglobales bacterium]|nr:PfkB family carbohydrate kinase [Terriglobales bacterium]